MYFETCFLLWRVPFLILPRPSSSGVSHHHIPLVVAGVKMEGNVSIVRLATLQVNGKAGLTFRNSPSYDNLGSWTQPSWQVNAIMRPLKMNQKFHRVKNTLHIFATIT